ncbi:hypothetical protein L1785_22015 [Antribacter sp. KLBMP9083]|uniref:Thiosulfate dehydrogenase [quinone] large subunit n=1 Tax=Antribacter soli TaxID=2910976 RepID=A0AA41QJY8_9MICO|nr:hypothetical protein [Antribacter soli]MCF4123642.1 hypothetical protein [Antribacter soli]
MTAASHHIHTVEAREVKSAAVAGVTAQTVGRYAFAGVRLLLAFEFLWAFGDKLFGWGLATPAERAWVNGGSPTTGYLSNVEGTFGGFFAGLAGNAFIDWLFMLGLLGIGAALALGIGLRIAAGAGVVLLMLMWLASLPLANNPFVDAHIIDAVVLVGLAAVAAGHTLGLGRWWAELPMVKKYPVLR